jgi:flagellar hook protein FlgE
MSFQQGLSGLNAAAKNLDVIGNNVANASTVGFKGAQAQFADVYANSLAGAGGTQVGIGVSMVAVAQTFSQGNLTTSANPLDVAINGNGFFRLSGNGTVTYSRNGQFHLDKDGYLVNATGERATGYPAGPTGQIVTATPAELRISFADVSPRQTSEATVVGNLDSRSQPLTAAFDPADPTTYHNATSMSVYDSLGNPHTLSLYFAKTAANTWSVYGTNDGAAIGTGALGTLAFQPNGSIAAPPASSFPTAIGITSTSGAFSPFNVTLDFDGSTQFGSAFGVNELRQDGFASGKLTGFSIAEDGTVLGRYSNGLSRAQGQFVLANFTNPNGLQPLGRNQWAETAASGVPLVGGPKSGNLGVVQSGAVEESNVDLTQELVNMITAQRVYQANAQTVKTQDAVLQTLVNLR